MTCYQQVAAATAAAGGGVVVVAAVMRRRFCTYLFACMLYTGSTLHTGVYQLIYWAFSAAALAQLTVLLLFPAQPVSQRSCTELSYGQDLYDFKLLSADTLNDGFTISPLSFSAYKK